MTLQQLLEETHSSLASGGVEEASLEADLLLMKALGLDRARLYSWPERPIAPQEKETLAKDLSRRLGGEPWPYICGHREFYGLDMAVGPGVFIPRPETELLVELALEIARSLPAGQPLRIVDVGTGSGAIAVSLAVHMPEAVIYATDISSLALETARLNCQRHLVQERVTLLKGNLLEPVPQAVDIVVSNPPYVPSADIPHLPREVRFEPFAALDGGQDGLDVFRSLMAQVQAKLRSPGGLIVEMSPTQSAMVCALTRAGLPGCSYSLVKDLSGRERALLAKVP